MDGLDDFQRAEQVQREAWGYNDIDVAPASIFSVARTSVARLWRIRRRADGWLALSFGAADGGHAHFHSHMVGVAPEYQNRGLDG